MEMPIQIMVVLFIALIIGGVVITFSEDSLFNSKQNLDAIIDNSDLSDEEKIIEVNSISTNNLVSLVNQCFKDKENSLENNLCFVILGDISTSCDEIKSEIENVNFDCSFDGSGNSIKISYNAPLNKIEVS